MYSVRAAGIVTSVLLALCPAFAQSPWVTVTPGGVYRDAVSDPCHDAESAGMVLLADYARSRVIRVNPATGESTEAFALAVPGGVSRPTGLVASRGGDAPFAACVGGQYGADRGQEMPCFLYVQKCPVAGAAPAHTSIANSKTLIGACVTGDNLLLLADPATFPVTEVVEHMGADRVLFGSDWPHIEGMPQPLDYLPELKGLDDDQRRLVLHANVTELTAVRPA